MAIKTANISIRGIRSLLWNHFSAEHAIPLERKEKQGVAGNNPEEWRNTVLTLKNGQLYIEPTYIFGCLRDAARHTKSGRGSIQTKVAATLQVCEEFILAKDLFLPLESEISRNKQDPVYLDVRSVKNPSTKGRNIRYRIAASPGWEMDFTIEWDASIVDSGQMEAVLIDAGQLVGLGDARNIGFGRFEVLKLQIKEKKRKNA